MDVEFLSSSTPWGNVLSSSLVQPPVLRSEAGPLATHTAPPPIRPAGSVADAQAHKETFARLFRRSLGPTASQPEPATAHSPENTLEHHNGVAVNHQSDLRTRRPLKQQPEPPASSRV
jgi:hypothetical protein